MRTFEYGLTLNEILDMPYCLYEDIVLKQIQIKKKRLNPLNKKMDVIISDYQWMYKNRFHYQ